ncbi:putative membrane protein insertion efficiency factor [Campylobacterota bacterium]|nr:putative membrane protein insertion efficiency factor [Campylobacterota bacterium]
MPLANRVIAAAVRAYQRTLSIVLGRQCRFYPTCSEYALWTLEHRNIFAALWLIIVRITRCNPLCTGGIDYPKVSLKAVRRKVRPLLFTRGNYRAKIRWYFVPDHQTIHIIKAVNDANSKTDGQTVPDELLYPNAKR